MLLPWLACVSARPDTALIFEPWLACVSLLLDAEVVFELVPRLACVSLLPDTELFFDPGGFAFFLSSIIMLPFTFSLAADKLGAVSFVQMAWMELGVVR